MPTTGIHPPCSCGPSYKADQNNDVLHYVKHGVSGWPWYPWESLFRDVPARKNHRQETCCRHTTWCSWNCCGKYHRHFSKQNGCRNTDSGEKCVELVVFSSLVTLQNKKRKVAQPQATRKTSSPGGLCSRATFRQSQHQTCTIVDRSSLTSALISACPLAASDVGSSDRRTNDLGALFVSVLILYHIVYLFSRTNR